MSPSNEDMTQPVLTHTRATTDGAPAGREPSRAADADSAGLQRVVELGAQDHHLAVLITLDRDGSPQVSVVNCAVVDDPGGDGQCVALVARRGAKTRNLRGNPPATLVVRSGWEWIAVSGPATVISRDDGLPIERFEQLLRDVFHAAGGQHDDLATYDQVMAAERRCAVLIRPERFTSNPAGAEHREPTS